MSSLFLGTFRCAKAAEAHYVRQTDRSHWHRMISQLLEQSARSFRDNAGNLITPRKETAAHYHCRIECVKAAQPGFDPYSLHVPTDVYGQLSSAHREYLRGVFGLSV